MGLQTDVDINVEPAYNGVVGLLMMGTVGLSEKSVSIYPLAVLFTQKHFCLLKL